jgi:hypothetical protein
VKRGLAAEYLTLAAIVAAIRSVRARGVTELEAYTPVPSDAIDAALGAPRSPLSIAAGIGGLVGAVGGYALQWLLVAYLYPLDVGSRPPHMPLAFTIITVEMGFLFGALFAVVAFAFACRLGRLWDPIFEVPGFESATRAGYWLAVGTTDPAIEAALAETRPAQLHRFGGAA